MSRLILASASPQRQRLLASIGLTFDVAPATVVESDHPEPDPPKRAVMLAREKAVDVAKRHPDAFVIGCDTLVVASDGTLLEKPIDEMDARRMLEKQSGGASIVHSGLCIVAPCNGKRDTHNREHVLPAVGLEYVEGLSSSKVLFKKLDQYEVDWWMNTGLWRDRSGAFQIDGPGQLMIERIEGDWTGVIGFPVFLFGQLMKEAGMSLN